MRFEPVYFVRRECVIVAAFVHSEDAAACAMMSEGSEVTTRRGRALYREGHDKLDNPGSWDEAGELIRKRAAREAPPLRRLSSMLFWISALVVGSACGESPTTVCKRIDRDICARIVVCHPEKSFDGCVKFLDDNERCDDALAVFGDVDNCETDIAHRECAALDAGEALCPDVKFR